MCLKLVILSICITLISTAKLPPDQAKQCRCGTVKSIGERIVGGNAVSPHIYPWMAVITRRGGIHCAGSVINDRYILTAGHCLNGVSKSDISVVLGLHDRRIVDDNIQFIKELDKFIMHEKFTAIEEHDIFDIALIKVVKPIIFNQFVSPICLPTPGTRTDYDKLVGIIAGWGRVGDNKSTSEVILKANVKIVSDKECMKSPIGEDFLDTMMCAYNLGVDACQGDSGGPLVVQISPERFEQIGVVSWGIGCATPSIPGVYTRLTKFNDWVLKNTKDGLYCGEQKYEKPARKQVPLAPGGSKQALPKGKKNGRKSGKVKLN